MRSQAVYTHQRRGECGEPEANNYGHLVEEEQEVSNDEGEGSPIAVSYSFLQFFASNYEDFAHLFVIRVNRCTSPVLRVVIARSVTIPTRKYR